MLLIYQILPILTQKPSLWHLLSKTLGTGILFLWIKLHRQPIKLLTRRVLKILSSEPWVAVLRFGMGSCGSPWVLDISASGHPHFRNRRITLNRTNPTVPRTWDGYHQKEVCSHSVSLKNRNWFGPDWLSCPSIYWVALNGTQWLCGTNFWPRLPPGSLGHYTLGFPWAWEKVCPTVTKIVKLPLLKATWALSVFHWYHHLAIIYVLSIGLEHIVAYIRALTKFTQALNDSQQSLSLLNTERSLVRKAVPQNRMALDIITASQWGICVISQRERDVFITDELANITSLLNHMRTQVNSQSDLTPNLGDVVNQLLESWGS